MNPDLPDSYNLCEWIVNLPKEMLEYQSTAQARKQVISLNPEMEKVIEHTTHTKF